MRIQSRLNSKPRPLGFSLARLSSAAAVCAALLAGVGGAEAAVLVWDPLGNQSNSGGIGTWDQVLTNLVWNDDNIAPDLAWVNANLDTASFGGTGGAVTLGEAISAGGLVFDVTGYNITGPSTLTLGGAAAVTVTNLADTTTITSAIAGTVGLAKAGNGTLVLGGANTGLSGQVAITGGTLSIAAANNLGDSSLTNNLSIDGGTLRMTATLDLGVNRTIAVGASGATLSAATATTTTVSGALSGANALGVTGGGTVVLSANNPGFSGDVNVDSLGGTANTTLRLSNSGALTSGTVTLAAGTVAGGTGTSLDLTGVTISGVTLAMNSASTFRSALTTSAGANIWGSDILLNGDGLNQLNTLGAGSSLTVGGNINDGGGFTGTLFVRGVGTGTIFGNINIPSGNVSKTDSGTWTIGAGGNSWLATNVAVGTLKIGVADAIPTTSAVTLGQNDANVATLDLSGFSQTIASLATNPIAAGANTNTKSVTNSTGTPVTLTVNGSGSTTYAGFLSGPMALLKQGAGTLALAGGVASTQTGAIRVEGGVLSITADNQLGAAANGITLDTGGTLRQAFNGQVTLGASRTITIGTGVGGGIIDVSNTGPTGKLFLGTAGQLVGGASSVLTKTGNGTLQLTSANTGYFGTVVVNGGQVEVQNGTALGSTPPEVTIGGTGEFVVTAPSVPGGWVGPIVASGGGMISGNSGNSTYAGGITANGAFSVGLRDFNATATGRTLTISGPISGAGAMAVVGPTAGGGTLLLSGNNSGYSGNISVGAFSTVQIQAGQAAGTGGFSLNGGTLRLNASNITGFTAGVQGLNATYYNLGANAGGTVRADNRFASELLALDNGRFATGFVDPNINIPNSGSGFQPSAWHPGFHVSAANAQEGVAWSGSIDTTLTGAGTYTFTSSSDDGSLLYIDGVQVVSNDGGHGIPGPTPTGAITLSAGQHSIYLKVANGGGGGAAQLSWSGPGIVGTVPVPSSVLSTATATGNLPIGPLSLPDAGAATTSTLDLQSDSEATSLSLGTNQTLLLTSPTISTLTVTGASTLTGPGTLIPASGKLVLNGAIGESVAGTGLTIGVPAGNALGSNSGNGYIIQFNGAGGYTGTTNVVGSQLQLNATGSNSIAGNLTVNALNLDGPIKNVILQQANQIADTALVTVQGGILEVGANNDTIDTLTVSGGRIMGSGVLTPTTAINLTGGQIDAGIGGILGLTKAGVGTVTLGGNSTYTGQTLVTVGALRIAGSNALGATGGGNDTVVSPGAQLQVQGGIASGEDISIAGTGLAGTGALRNLAGSNSIAPTLVLTGVSTIQSDSGNLNLAGGLTTGGAAVTFQGSGETTITGAIVGAGAGSLTKIGNGTLTLNQNANAGTLGLITHTAGILGFSGTQSFGASTIGSGLAYKFYGDPTAGVDVTASANSAVIAGLAADQALLSRINIASAGAYALGVNSANNLDFSAHATLGLGAYGLATYSGTITPNAAGYRFSGALATGNTPNILKLTNPLTGANSVTLTGGTLDLGGLTSTFTGAINVNGGTLRLVNNTDLGAAGNVINLNGGTLEYNYDSYSNGALFAQLGNVLATGQRTINIGAAGGTLAISSFGFGTNLVALSGVNPLTGSGTLTRTGFGNSMLMSPTTFSGALIIANQTGNFEMRGSGALPNVLSVEVNQSSIFVVDNQNGFGPRQFANTTNNQDRVRDAAPITLKGGQLFYRSRNVAAQISETFGTVATPEGQNTIRIEKAGTVGGEIIITNLARPVGGGTVLFSKNGGTFGTAGDNARIFLTNVNGAAPGVVNLLGGWGYNVTDFQWVGYSAANGIINSTNTDQGAAAFTPAAANIINLNAAATATLNDAAGNAHDMLALRFGNGAAQTLAFTDGTNDVLYIGSGGILNDNSNFTRAIGTTAQRGKLTAGTSTAGAGAKELFFHANQNTTTVESIIVDNNGNAVTVVKDLNGTVQLNAANTYTGGTSVFAGRLNVALAGGLGSGPVLVKGAALELRAAGTTTAATAVITARDGSEVFLQNTTALYNTAGDRYSIDGGSIITGNTNNAGQNFAVMTRLDVAAPFTAGGQVKLSPNATVRSVASVDGDIMTNMIANLGTSADLYYNQPSGGGANQFINIGQGTPWKGVGSAVGGGWAVGTINASSDFWLQGLTRIAGNVALTVGGTGVGSYAINNLAGGPINAFVEGQVALSEDSPVSMPGNLTFVVTPGGYLQPNFSNSFGAQAGNLNARVIVQAGGTIDPGPFVTVGAAGNQAQGIAYPAPSPLNTNVTFEAGGRLLINDASGIGSTTGGATFLMKANSILELVNSQAFLGSDAGGLIHAGQFVYETGAIVRQNGDRIFKQDAFVNNEPNGKNTTLELFGNRNVTDAVDPRIVIAVGTPTVVPMTLTFGSGGLITNDSNDRTMNERRGGITLENGATLAATSQTFMNIQESVTVPAGATLNIGSTSYVDGNPKNGLVQFTGTASNVFGAGAKLVVQDGSAFGFNGTHTFPDTTPIEIPAAVTNVAPVGAVGFNPGNGSTLLINTDNYMEIMGALTGNGAVIGNVGTPIFAPGYGATSDFTFAGGVRNANTRNPSMTKVGSTKMTLTGFNDTQGRLGVMEGEVSLAGANGKWAGGEMNIGKGGILTFDNTVNAVADRQSNTGGAGNRFLTTLGGGEFRVLGHATDVADVTMFGLGNSAGGNVTYGGNMGGFGKVTISPSGDLTALRTSVTLGQVERFDNSGERNSAWLLRGIGLGGLPGTYSSAGVYTANAGNPKDGLIFITDPNFTAAGAFDASGNTTGIIFGAPGTPVVPTAGLLLGATSASATEGDFVTIDVATGGSRTAVRILQASEYTNSLTSGANITTGLNVQAAGALNATGDTRFQVLKLDNGASLNVAGTLPALTQAGQVILNGGGILVPTGSTATLSASNNGAGADSVIRTAGGVSAYVHSFGNLNVNGEFFSDLGLVKTGSGTATFAAGSLSNLRGRIALHEGTLNINDSLSNVRQAAISAVAFQGIHMELNGGTLNLNGKSQLFGRLESGNFLTTASTEGGIIISATPATITITDGGGFSGHIAGAISYDKIGNNTHILHGTNPYTGTTTVRQGTLLLRADATLSNTTQVDLNYARIDIDDGHLAYVPDRINTAATINLRGADFVNRGRAGTLTQQHLGTVNMLAGTNLFQTLAGGGGATETYFNNFNRSLGTMASFQQNYGFTGTAGNDTTAIRYLINNISINGGAATTAAALTTLNNGILGGWAIANNDNFATYSATNGIGAMGNTEDGFANYNAGDLSTATATQNVNDGTARTIAASKTVNSFRYNAAGTITINAGQTLTLNTGGLLIVGGNDKLITGGSLTSNSGELNVWVNQNTTSIASQITGAIALTKGGNGALKLQGPGNNYSGVTYIGAGSSGVSNRSGELQLDVTGANGTTIVAIPGDLHIHQTQVTELQASQIAETANVFLYGGSILRLRDAASITETLRSINFLHAGGQDFNRPNLDRANAQATSTLRLTGPTPISSDNSNTVDIPGIHGQIGNLAFAGSNGSPQTLMVNSPVTVNGNAAAGLLIDPIITQVPTGVDDGGLVKAGTGMVVIRGVNTFGNPGVPTEVFNVQSGFVRADNNGPLGGVNAITTVQNGAVLLLNGNTGLTGSLQMKDGSTLSLTLASGTIGAVPSTGTLDVPSGATTTVGLLDYFVPSTNTGNVVVNHQLIGSGTINLTGIEYASGYNGGGIFQLRNEANSFSGAINIGTNAILEANTNGADLTGNTFGTATLNLNGGVLRIRDAGNNLAGAQTITYGNNVNLNADSMIDLDRLGTVANQKTVALGTLNIGAASWTLSTPYGTGASITPNDYRIAFAQVDGAGTLVKGGSRFVDINGYAGGFSGNITVAGPKGLNLPASGNLTLNAAGNSIANLTVGGFHNFAAGKTVTLSSTLNVTSNPGEVVNGLGGVNTGGIVGVVTLNSTSTVSAAVVKNNGVIAANNSAATLTAPSIQGTGLYQAYGQNLTLDGALANDGGNATTLKVAGTSTSTAVILTSTGSLNTGGAEVQSGILRLSPTGGTALNPLGSGAIRVHGAPASILGVGSQPIAAQNAKLEFASTTMIKQSGDITNTGTVRTSSGLTKLPGFIRGTAPVSSSLTDFLAGTVPGMLEGRFTTTAALPDTNAAGRDLTAARPANPGNFGVRLEPRMGQTDVVTQNGLTGWSDNTAWIYTGYFFDADGIFTFIENEDDQTLVSIDGVNRILTNGADVTSTASQKGQRGITLNAGTPNTAAVADLITAATPLASNPNLPAGWHTIEIRFENGGGGAGPWVGTGNGFGNNYGFGLNPDGTMALDGTQALRPIDPGDGTLFRTAAAGKGVIQVEGGSTLNLGGFEETALVNVGTEGTPSFLNIEFSSTTDALVIGNGSIVTLGVPVGAPSAASDEGIPNAAFDEPSLLGSQGGGLVASPVQGVPEPGTATLLFGGLLTMLGFRRRR